MTETPYNSVSDERFASLCDWLLDNGISTQGIHSASTDAGFRRYFRVPNNGNTVIAVDAPPEWEDSKSFIDIAGRLRDSKLRVPAIHCYDLENGFMVQEDFGTRHMQNIVDSTDSTDADIHKLYSTAVDAIITMQQSTATRDLPRYDKAFLRSELELFPHWYIREHLQQLLTDHRQQQLSDAFELILDVVLQQPIAFVHRDYHCRNLMIIAPSNDLGIIDFQGALAGPVTYDSVSLMRDVYLDLPTEFQNACKQQHRQSLVPVPTEELYNRWFDFTGLQRHLKILGIFCRLHYRDGKSLYLNNLPTVKNHIEKVVRRYPELKQLSALFDSIHQH